MGVGLQCLVEGHAYFVFEKKPYIFVIFKVGRCLNPLSPPHGSAHVKVTRTSWHVCKKCVSSVTIVLPLCATCYHYAYLYYYHDNIKPKKLPFFLHGTYYIPYDGSNKLNLNALQNV